MHTTSLINHEKLAHPKTRLGQLKFNGTKLMLTTLPQ